MNDSELNIISPEKLNEYDTALNCLQLTERDQKHYRNTWERRDKLIQKKEKTEMDENLQTWIVMI